MKKTIIGLLILILLIAAASCSNDPSPQIRVQNDRSEKVDVKIRTSLDTELSINGVDPGQTSSYKAITEGNVTATAVVQNESVSFKALKDKRYTIVISMSKAPIMQIDD